LFRGANPYYDNHHKVAKINKKLQESGLITWFDSDRMKGEIVDQMTSGIDDAQVVVVFITKNYMEKVGGANGSTDNCKIEFSYAYRHKKPELMIPVVMEKDMRNNALWKGALGAALGGALYLDFSDEDESVIEENCRKLYQEIVSRITPYFSSAAAVEQPLTLGFRAQSKSDKNLRVRSKLTFCLSTKFFVRFFLSLSFVRFFLRVRLLSDKILLFWSVLNYYELL
jgi:hypothetical protein